MTMQQWLALLGAALALVTALFGAGQKYGELTQRIQALEDQARYLHGTFTLPKE